MAVNAKHICKLAKRLTKVRDTFYAHLQLIPRDISKFSLRKFSSDRNKRQAFKSRTNSEWQDASTYDALEMPLTARIKLHFKHLAKLNSLSMAIQVILGID